MDYIPRTDADFSAFELNFMAYLESRYPGWKITPDALTNVMMLRDRWRDMYAITQNPETRTSVALKDKIEARKLYEAELRKFVKSSVQYNIYVTDHDRNSMGLTVPSTSRKPVPVPTTYPEAEVDSSMIRCLTIHFHDTGSTRKAKPQGVHGAEIRWGILDAPNAKVADLTHSEFDTRSPFTLEFTDDERGKTVYFCLRWENTRGEKGRWGEIISAIIP